MRRCQRFFSAIVQRSGNEVDSRGRLHFWALLIDKDDTTNVYGAGKKKDIQVRCDQIIAQVDETPFDYDKEKLRERLAKLSGEVALICAGGATEPEVKERKDRVEDAMNATRAAVDEVLSLVAVPHSYVQSRLSIG